MSDNVNGQAAQESEERKPETKEQKLARLEKELKGMLHVEKAIRQSAVMYAKKMGVRENHFRVSLVEGLIVNGKSADMSVTAGPVVDIFFNYPQPMDKWGSLIRSALSFMSRHPDMRTPVEIVPMAYVKKMRGESRKWHKEKFGDYAEIIANMIPRSRLVEEVIVTHTLRDRMTGLEVSVSYPEGKRMPYDVQREMRVSLSRIVNAVEIEEIEEIENADRRLDVRQGNDVPSIGNDVPGLETALVNPFAFVGEVMWLYDREDIS